VRVTRDGRVVSALAKQSSVYYRDPAVAVFPTCDGRGHGVIARDILPRDSFLAEYCAEVRDMRARPRGPEDYVSVANIGGHHLLDTWAFSNWTGFINHGEPGHANVVASVFGPSHNRVAIHVGGADILPNQELLLCYSEGMSAYFEASAKKQAQAQRDRAQYNTYLARKKALDASASEEEELVSPPRVQKRPRQASRSPS